MNTDLIKIERPFGTALNVIALLNAKAYAGEVVEIFVYIKNQYSATIGIKPRAIVNGVTEVVFTPEYSNVPSGQTYYWVGSFLMPNADANIRAESYYYGVDGQWYFEDYQTRTINLAAAPPEPELKRLVINRSPTIGGTVTVSPLPTTGTVYDGYYPKGTTVYVTAHPNTGYKFKNWSGELTDTTNLTAPVYMTENRTITANFEVEVVLKLLKVLIDPLGGGYVTVTPTPSSGTQHNWYFPSGTQVYVTVHPYAGYTFESWSGEMTDTTEITAPVYPMTEERVITAHLATPEVETLRVDITPIGKGYVTTLPASEEGKTTWHNSDTGTFPHGTSVQVTAYPSVGYVFEKWSDEIIGGVSYDNPSYVQDMTEHRAVKAHFREEEEEPVLGKGELTEIVIHWQEYTDLVPPTEIEKRGSYEIHPVCKNIGLEVIQFRVNAMATKPSGVEVVVIDIDGWPYTSAGSEFKPTLNMGGVDEIGTWTAVINLYNHETEELLDSWSGDLFTVKEAAPGTFDMIGSLLVLGLMAGIIIPMTKEGV